MTLTDLKVNLYQTVKSVELTVVRVLRLSTALRETARLYIIASRNNLGNRRMDGVRRV